MQPTQTAPHTIFGAGQIGRRLAEELLKTGKTVRLVRRSAPPTDAHPSGRLHWLQGDATDPRFAQQACAGAEVVYNCTNPTTYYNWKSLLPPLFNGIRLAATHAKARLVVLDNLYMYGPANQGHMHEGVAMQPTTQKGELRRELAHKLFEAHARGDVRACTARASDYFGPGGVNTVVSNPRALERMAQGKAVEVLGDPSAQHSFNYIPDVARGLAQLGQDAKADGKVWHLPAAWQGTTHGLVRALAAAWGQDGKVRPIPVWALRGAGVFSPTMRGLFEMRYQWTHDFVLDDQRFREAFDFAPTAMAQAVAETAASLQLQQAA